MNAAVYRGARVIVIAIFRGGEFDGTLIFNARDLEMLHLIFFRISY